MHAGEAVVRCRSMESILRSSAGVRSARGEEVRARFRRGSLRGCGAVGGRRTGPACPQSRFPSAAWTVAAVSWRQKRPGADSGCAPPTRAVASGVQVGLVDGSPQRLNAKRTEELLEKIIYRCRFFTLLGVLGSLVGSVLCFLKGSVYVATSFMQYFTTGGKVTSVLIEGIDVYLLGTVMLVFGMGLYELFISNLDIAKISSQRSNLLGLFMLQERPKWLEIKSVNELKTKVGHVIVMVLLVGLFDKVQKVGISTPMDLLCFTSSILLSSCGLYLLSKLTHSKTPRIISSST